jgi:NitT/TauT family transport system permease protein/putative hydroxymethylpyrimidine transport system permease protein
VKATPQTEALELGDAVRSPELLLTWRLRLFAGVRRPAPRDLLAPMLVVLALLGAWECYVDLGGANPLILPAPHAIASSLYTDRALLWSNFLVTAEEVLLGIALAMPAGLAISILIHLSKTLRKALYPLLVASQTVPIPIIAPVLVLWLGFGLLPKLSMVALVSFFPVVVTTLAGLESVDPDLIKLMRTFDASRLRIFREVELPAALPGVFTGAKLAAVFAVLGAVFAEWAGASSGLGYLFNVSLPQLLMARAYACVAVLSAFAIALFALLSAAERLALPWTHQSTGEPRR